MIIRNRNWLITISLTTLLFMSGCDDGVGNSALQNETKQATPQSAQVQSYTCPMHPHYISTDADGNCPICGMDLVPVEGNKSTVTASKGNILYYKNPMGLPDTSPVPKKDSMGMEYIAVYADNIAGGAGVAVSPEMIQTMGIRTTQVGLSHFGGDIRAYGQVEANTRLETVSASRLEGWIENISVKAVGDRVKRGAVLYRIYSPDLIGAQKEYLASLQIGNSNRIAAVRQRLKSKGLQESAITRLTKTRELIERIPVYAENSGIVSMLHIREGDYIKPGSPIIRLQSYSNVWVIAAVAETDLPSIQKSMPVSLRFESASDAPNTGVVDYIYPTIDPKTRTARVRIEVANISGSLRPGAYADVLFKDPAIQAERLSVPTQAVLRDSIGSHVIISLGDGRFEPRVIKTGISGNGRTEVISGVSLGDKIVTSGQFLLDSEANLREGLSKLTAPASAFDATTALSELPINAETLGQIDHLVDAALYFHEALIDGYAIDPYFLDPIVKLADGLEIEFAGSKLEPIITNAKKAILAAKLDKQSSALETHLSSLTTSLDLWLTVGAPAHYKSKGLIFYSDPVSGRTWLQESGMAANPYGGTGGDVIAWPDPMASSMDDMK